MGQQEQTGAKTLQLRIKPVYLQQILHGYKNSEYRERTDYYKGLLVEEETIDRPADEKAWVRCLDGAWRKFKGYTAIKLKCPELGSATFRIKSIDCSSSVYVIRLGEQIGRQQIDSKYGKAGAEPGRAG